VTGFLATVIPEKLVSQELDTSVGVSGPHGFTVRHGSIRHAPPSRPPHLTARSWRSRAAPLIGWDVWNVDWFAISENQNIFSKGALQTFGDLPVGLLCRGSVRKISLAREAKQDRRAQ
jgi:hypothetical protein